MAQLGHLSAWRLTTIPAAGLAAALGALWLVWGGFLPNASGRLGVDYAVFLPDILAGTFWHMASPVASVPWFIPSQCAGVPYQADPQGAYLALPQLLAFWIGPLGAVQMSFLVYAALGFAGTHRLATRAFGCTPPASLLAASLFALNGFYAARMMVGHLAFAPFMLVPALACCLLEPASARHPWRPIIASGLGFAVMLEGGMAVLVLPACLCLLILVAMHALATGGGVRAPVLRLALGGGLGIALCAGKLAAVLALMAHVPRDIYPLPGEPNIALAAWLAIRCLFLWPTGGMTNELVNNALTLEAHEFDYRVGPVPLLLMVVGWLVWRRQPRAPATPRTRLLWESLAVLLLLPLALNTHAPLWTGFLKHIPVLHSASSLLRWFAAYIPAAVIGAALGLDRALAGSSARWLGAAAGVAATLACLLLGDRDIYGAAGLGVYDPAPVEASWRQATASGQVPPILRLAVPRTLSGQEVPSITRQNLLTQGASPLLCYNPLFGYRLEAFHQGTLHDGPILDETQVGTRTELNLKNPACYVFPGANGCAPGDTFLASQQAAATDFAAYRPFAFAKPWWAREADWLGLLAAGAALLGMFL